MPSLRSLVPKRRAVLAVAGLVVVAMVATSGFIGALGAFGKAPRSGPSTASHGVIASRAPLRALEAGTAAGAGLIAVPSAVPPSAPYQAPVPGLASGGQPARIEETGAVTLLVSAAQIQLDVNRLMGFAVGSGGFVASTSTQSASPGSPAQGTVTLQVPVGSFATVLDEVKDLGKVASLTTSATDVTGQYVDLQAQITALEDSRQQYLTIMTKATTIGGILAVQSQLDSLQSQLGQLQGQLKTLTTQTTYATIDVTLTQQVVTPPPPKPASSLLRAWRSAVGGFVAGCEGVVRVAGPLLFALLLIGALFFAGRFAWRFGRRSARKTAPRQLA